MTCPQCGGSLNGDDDRCWCTYGRFNENEVRKTAEQVLDTARSELVGDALAVVEALARQDGQALTCLLGNADLTATTVILASVILDLLTDLSTWQPDGTTATELIERLRDGRA
jgi:hypothetical protein